MSRAKTNVDYLNDLKSWDTYSTQSVSEKLKETVSAADFGMSVSSSSATNKTALEAALAASNSVTIPISGTIFIDGPIDITGKRISGNGIYKTILKIPGTNTQTTLFYNNKTSSASWGTGGGFELRDISLHGNWDGSTTLVDQTWDNTAALVKFGAGAGIRMIDVQLYLSYGHNASFHRLGYATFTRVKITAARKNGLHFEAPSGSDAVTSTWIQNCDLNSNRGVANIYVKNGVGVWINGNVFEDAAAGVYLDGADNRNVTIINNHCETNTNGILHYVGSGANTTLTSNFCDTDITRTNLPFQKLYAHSNIGMFNGIETGSGPIYQDTTINGKITLGDGTPTNTDKAIDFFSTANYLDQTGRIRWRSNNSNNANEPLAQIKAVQRGLPTQNYGALYFGTGKNGLVDRMWITPDGEVLPFVDNAYPLGLASYRWSVVYAATGTINTSDERAKQDVESLNEAEIRVAKSLKQLIKKFKFKDAVILKGDNARIHIGVIAQEVISAFEAQSLDPMRYAIVCYDKWDAEYDEHGNITKQAGDRYGIRYEELLAFIVAAL